MRANHWTQTKFAKECKLTGKTISAWRKTPDELPSLDSLKKISKGTGRTIKWLQSGEGEEFVSEVKEQTVNVSGKSSYKNAGRDIVKTVGGSNVYELTDDEREFIDLYRKSGNKTILDKCSRMIQQVDDFIKHNM